MNKIPVAFAFDNNLTMPAAVCLYSLFVNALPTTVYDIFVLHRKGNHLDMLYINKVMNAFPQHNLTQIEVGDTFDRAFEVRDITTPAYYRLLIPTLIPQYKKVIYCDTDIIIRQDLSSIYTTNLADNYFGAVKDCGLNLTKDGVNHIISMPEIARGNYINSGFLLINSALINSHNLTAKLIETAKTQWKFQDQDILNIVCTGKIMFVPPKYNMLNYSYIIRQSDLQTLARLYKLDDYSDGFINGNIHYNGQKPWKGWCVNFDIWWEYYRKSPVFDPKFYFDFFYNRLNEHDMLPLWKRIKILLRYFVFGRKRL